MGKILSSYKKSIIEDVINSINANSSHYYAFAANPVPLVDTPEASTNDDYSNVYLNNWYLMFGKKLGNTDIMPMIRNIEWTANTVYSRYDNTSTTLANSEFYVAVTPGVPGQPYHIYKCIDNADGANCTVAPDLQQPTSFTKSDGYTWRYMYTISDANYTKFATSSYIPVTPNTSIATTANNYSGIEVVVIESAGSGYRTYHDGIVQSVVNTTVVQIESDASIDNDHYVNNGIYIHNVDAATSQLKVIVDYVSNSSGNWVFLNEEANTSNITAGVTEYKISPQIKFDTDGDDQPKAYSTVNATANSIESVTIIDIGTGISRATATVVSNSVFGTGASLYCIVPPPGGHGADVKSELGVVGMGISFTFDDDESNTIPTNVTYNKIGIYKNPLTLLANLDSGSIYSNATFNQLTTANVTLAAAFANNDTVTGATSGATGVVAFSNTTQVYLVGDKNFANGENIISSNGEVSVQLSINNIGNIFTNNLWPIYTQNIDDATRAPGQSETFKLIIQV